MEKKRTVRKIARERIEILFALAGSMARSNEFALANRYAELILKIAKKNNIRLEKEKKMFICGKCGAFLYPGKTATVRLKHGKIIIKCHTCRNYKRYPIR